MKNTEILAPAGNIDSLKSAVLHGADAVYFGLSEFNARIKADNFNFDNLGEWVDFCHFYGVKVYLTLNVMIKEKEIERLAENIRQAVFSNVDAFIVTDMATIELCQKIAPTIPLHFSTQFGVHNLEGATRAKELGATRVILSRETPLSEIKRIKDSLDIEIEVFVHGALCVGFSGNCYMSSMIDGNSGNRGLCKQPCRKNYSSSVNEKSGYFLSTNDLCLIDEVAKLQDLGVTSLKIEGRLKSPEYVASTVVAYKKALLGAHASADVDNIKLSYARTFTNEGYLYGKNYDIINPKLQNNAGLFVGTVSKVSALNNGLNKVSFLSNRKLEKDVGLKFLINDTEIGGSTLTSTKTDKSGNYEVYTRSDVRVGANVCVTQSPQLLKGFEERKLCVRLGLKELAEGEYEISISDYKDVFRVCFSVQEKVTARNANNRTGLSNVLSKGCEPFVVDGVDLEVYSNVLLPFSLLNKYRKECFEGFKALKLQKYKKQKPANVSVLHKRSNGSPAGCAVIVSDYAQLSEVLLETCDVIIYAPFDYSSGEVDVFLQNVKNLNNEIYLNFPTFLAQKDIEVLYKIIEKYNTCISGIYGNNVAIQSVAKKFSKKVFCGHGFNIANNFALEKLTSKKVLSVELNEKELNSLTNSNTYVYSLGYLPLMIFVHCPSRANGSTCQDCEFDKNGSITYKDKVGCFTIRRIKVKNCYFELYNTTPTYLIDLKDRIDHGLLFDLRNLSRQEIKAFEDGLKGNHDNFENKMRGHFYRGVQ